MKLDEKFVTMLKVFLGTDILIIEVIIKLNNGASNSIKGLKCYFASERMYRDQFVLSTLVLKQDFSLADCLLHFTVLYHCWRCVVSNEGQYLAQSEIAQVAPAWHFLSFVRLHR